jgi:hypothetical protein
MLLDLESLLLLDQLLLELLNLKLKLELLLPLLAALVLELQGQVDAGTCGHNWNTGNWFWGQCRRHSRRSVHNAEHAVGSTFKKTKWMNTGVGIK